MHNTKWKTLFADVLYLLLGSLFFAISVDMFTAPNNIAPGGLTGVATMLNYLSVRWHLPFEIPIGMASLVMNVPLLIAAWMVIGRRTAIRTVIGLALSSVMIDLLEPILPPFVGDETILVCIFGGLLMGLGVGLILARGGTTGGSEVVARLLERKYPHIQMGKLILAVDGVVIALSAVVYGQLQSPLYAVVLVFLSSLATDWVVYGGRQGKMAMVLSQNQEAITNAVFERLGRGVTLLKSTGAYTGKESHMMLVAVRRDEVFRLRQMVFEHDPDAFFMLLSTDEVRGLGFMNPHE